VQRFEVHYRRVNCFHDAVVVEVAGAGPKTLVERLVDAGAVDTVDPELFLPHVTIGAVNARTDASALRDVLAHIRGLDVGTQQVLEAQLCVVPASRRTILTPWTVVARVRFE
jgi:2'-5' RNA ligase